MDDSLKGGKGYHVDWDGSGSQTIVNLMNDQHNRYETLASFR